MIAFPIAECGPGFLSAMACEFLQLDIIEVE